MYKDLLRTIIGPRFRMRASPLQSNLLILRRLDFNLKTNKMIRHYTFNYNMYDAEACFKVDTEKFKAEDAKLLLEFFTWDYDHEADPIDELMKKYAIKAIWVATSENYNEEGVKSWFDEQEGFIAIDGSQGVELTVVSAYEFDEDYLSITIKLE